MAAAAADDDMNGRLGHQFGSAELMTMSCLAKTAPDAAVDV